MSTRVRRPITPDDLMRIKGVADPQISPDGRRVAFVLATASLERDEYLANIWIVDVGGGEPRRFTTGTTRDSAPRWSPDGRWLAFVSERGAKKKPQLYVAPTAGGEAIALTDLANGVWAAAGIAWAPDSRRIAFVSTVGGWQEPESGDERGKSKPARVITTLKYRFEALGFTYDRRPHVFVVAIDGGGAPTQVTSGDFPDANPAWSPDGTTIAFVSERHDTRDTDANDGLYVVAATGGEPRLVRPPLMASWHPSWSHDGQSIAHGGISPGEDGYNFHVFVQAASGGDPVCLTATLDRSILEAVPPTWSADGEWLFFVARDRGTRPLFRVRGKGGDVAEAIVGGQRIVQGFSVARDAGTIAFVANDDGAFAELFICNPDGAGVRQLTHANRDWHASVELSRPERFAFHRAGFDIDGWAMKPPGFDPATRYPALLWIHGGPHSDFADGFWFEGQIDAAAGYALIYVNPRGTQGYGEAFSRASVGDWGGEDYADIMAGVDEALRRFPFIDGERLGVIGISYGGYMTSWVVGHSHRFKAACSEAGISNVATQVGTADIGHRWTIGEQGGVPPWDDPARYVARSPLTYVKDMRTPLLIVHGESDLRCHVIESEQLFVALKKLGREVVFVRMPDAGHGFGALGRPRQRLERFRIILDWFARYLRPGT